MNNYKAVVTYDGTKYHGWAVQKNNETIQQIIQNNLHQIFNKSVTIYGSGRTDAFVHAYNQVFSFKVDTQLKPSSILSSLNKMLPDDIKIKSLKNVDPDFNARFSAKSKEYIYKINLDKDNVFLNNYALLYIKPIDIKKIKECASFFVGVHNFLSFSISDIEDTVRTISTIKVIKKGKLIEIRVVGNGFLRGMVRMLIGAILDYNEDKKTKEDITKLLNNPKKGSSITKVRACGLYLNKVRY